MSVPYSYPLYNELMTSITPSTVHVHDSMLARFFQRYLLQKAMSVFEFKNMPDWWDRDYLLYVLFCQGFIGILNTKKFGTCPQRCTLGGYDLFYRPDRALFASPWITENRQLYYGDGDFNPETMAIILKLQPDYCGVMDAVVFYSDMMALCAETAGTNILNSKLSYLFGTSNKAAAEAMKKIFDKVASGEPAVVYDKSLQTDQETGNQFWQTFSQDLRSNYITPEVMASMIEWEHDFDKLIGIPFVETQKKERLITSEVERNTMETTTRSELWLSGLKRGLELVNECFGLDLSVERRLPDEDNDTIPAGTDSLES